MAYTLQFQKGACTATLEMARVESGSMQEILRDEACSVQIRFPANLVMKCFFHLLPRLVGRQAASVISVLSCQHTSFHDSLCFLLFHRYPSFSLVTGLFSLYFPVVVFSTMLLNPCILHSGQMAKSRYSTLAQQSRHCFCTHSLPYFIIWGVNVCLWYFESTDDETFLSIFCITFLLTLMMLDLQTSWSLSMTCIGFFIPSVSSSKHSLPHLIVTKLFNRYQSLAYNFFCHQHCQLSSPWSS